MKNTDIKIERIKGEIESSFKQNKAKKSIQDIEIYLDLKREFFFARTYIIYINHFIRQYDFLNNYTKNLASLIINNKEAIIKDAFVVITKNG
jgi:hypothetical protein